MAVKSRRKSRKKSKKQKRRRRRTKRRMKGGSGKGLLACQLVVDLIVIYHKILAKIYTYW